MPVPSFYPQAFRPQAYFGPAGTVNTDAILGLVTGAAIMASFVLGVVKGAGRRR